MTKETERVFDPAVDPITSSIRDLELKEMNKGAVHQPEIVIQEPIPKPPPKPPAEMKDALPLEDLPKLRFKDRKGNLYYLDETMRGAFVLRLTYRAPR